MAKSRRGMPIQHLRGEIKGDHLHALLSDLQFRCRLDRNQKGKGCYVRKAKHHKGFSAITPQNKSGRIAP